MVIHTGNHKRDWVSDEWWLPSCSVPLTIGLSYCDVLCTIIFVDKEERSSASRIYDEKPWCKDNEGTNVINVQLVFILISHVFIMPINMTHKPTAMFPRMQQWWLPGSKKKKKDFWRSCYRCWGEVIFYFRLCKYTKWYAAGRYSHWITPSNIQSSLNVFLILTVRVMIKRKWDLHLWPRQRGTPGNGYESRHRGNIPYIKNPIQRSLCHASSTSLSTH